MLLPSAHVTVSGSTPAATRPVMIMASVLALELYAAEATCFRSPSFSVSSSTFALLLFPQPASAASAAPVLSGSL